MSTPYIGEIRMFAGNFAPNGWAFCDGQLVAISENDTLFALLGTTYGGDGQSTFALPDLRGRRPLHVGTDRGASYQLGQAGGAETVALTTAQLAVHSHPPLGAVATASATSPAEGVWAATTSPAYAEAPGALTTAMAPDALAAAGDGHAHENLPPYLAIRFIISLFGIFPSQS